MLSVRSDANELSHVQLGPVSPFASRVHDAHVHARHMCAQATDPLTIATMREALMLCEDVSRSLSDIVLESERSLALQKSTRSDFMRTLKELIGPPPESKEWRDEWDELNIEFGLLKQDQEGKPRNRDTVVENMKGLAARGIGTIEAKFRNFKQDIEFKTSIGWTQADAEAHLCMTGVVGASIARALEERSARYAASTYALYMSLQRGAMLDKCRGVTPPPVYHHIGGGANSASEKSRRILSIEEADKYGFKGFTCMAELHGYDDPNLFTDDGEFMSRDVYVDGKATYKLNKGDVLMIVSKEPCEKTKTLRSVVQVTNENGACYGYRVPPNSLITMVKVHNPGEWEAYGKRPKRRCIEVGPPIGSGWS